MCWEVSNISGCREKELTEEEWPERQEENQGEQGSPNKCFTRRGECPY